MALTLKVAVVGPLGVGKSMLSNILAGHEAGEWQYSSTKGCRILEFDLNVDGRSTDGSRIERDVKIAVELWDVSGDHQYERCWLAIAKNLNGLICVVDPNSDSQQSELVTWHSFFSGAAQLQDAQCLVLAKPSNEVASSTLPKLVSPLDRIRLVSAVAANADNLRNEFATFAGTLFGYHPEAEFLDD